MKFTINLATRRYVNMRLLNASLVACLVILGGVLIFAVRELAYNQAELARIRNLSTGSRNRPAAAPVSETQLKALDARIRFANALIDKKSVNWLRLLDLLEEVVPNGVALSQIDPSQREKLLRINGVARNFADLRAFIENLEQSKSFSEVYLLSQSEAKVGLTQHGITFAVTCKVADK